jgi:nucleoside-diphosphate-sugar epimerase
MGTINMLGLAKRVKARILLASTSEIYGDPTVHPQPESYWGNVNTIGPRVSFLFCQYIVHVMWRDKSSRVWRCH